MIFLTVGTHEQGFNRLIEMMDEISVKINEPIFMQIGYSTVTPINAEYTRFLSADEMAQKMNEARLVVTHGGPASFFAALEAGKFVSVVPRLKKFGEHVNDHQIEFVEFVINNGLPIKMVETKEELIDSIISPTLNTYGGNEMVEKFSERLIDKMEELNKK